MQSKRNRNKGESNNGEKKSEFRRSLEGFKDKRAYDLPNQDRNFISDNLLSLRLGRTFKEVLIPKNSLTQDKMNDFGEKRGILESEEI